MDLNDSNWVDRRMDTLAPPAAWDPNSGPALSRFRQRQREASRTRARRIWFAAAAAAACVVVAVRLASPVRECCAQTLNVPAVAVNSRAITCELYSDYQCPHCADFYLHTEPLLQADFVDRGKLRIVPRNLPMPAHVYARAAAQYASAAQRIGRYDAVASQLYRTQAEWSMSGDIERQVDGALTPTEMSKLREVLAQRADLDASVNADVALARDDGVAEVPALVCLVKGQRQAMAPIPPYPLLKNYLDEITARNCAESGKTTC